MTDNTEKIIKNYEKYSSVLKKVIPAGSVSSLEENFGERLAVAPRGTTEKDGGYPGALVEFSLEVASAIKKISSHFGDPKPLIRVALLHEIGKIGDYSEDLFIPQDSEWHREKLGQNYKYSENCLKMLTSHRTIWLLNNLSIQLTPEETLSILTSQGLHLDENKFYGRGNYSIISALQAARAIVLNSNT